jgi:hypothetical protein
MSISQSASTGEELGMFENMFFRFSYSLQGICSEIQDDDRIWLSGRYTNKWPEVFSFSEQSLINLVS